MTNSLLNLSTYFKTHSSTTPGNAIDGRLLIYDQLDAYYQNNGLYQPKLGSDSYDASWTENMRGLRTCVNRVVEFYTAKLEPGTMPEAMPIVAKSAAVEKAIINIFLWSNLSSNKSVVLRKFALYGDTFIQSVVDTPDSALITGEASVPARNAMNVKVRHIFHEPRYVTSYEVDAHNNIIAIRLDIPQPKSKYYTEIWDLSGVKVWELHDKGRDADTSRLGTPTSSTSMTELGIDFVPFSHAKFRDVGDKFGNGATVHALDKIDEANRVATRLHEMLFRFNRPIWVALSNASDSQGKPLPPPVFGDGNTVDMGDESVIGMPGMSQLTSLVPNIQYESAVNILDSMIHEIEKDLPEMTYFDLKGQISGVAVRELMQDACDRVIEARQNFETALIIANKHALTLGSIHGVFTDIGTYENGDFDHTFLERDVLGMSVTERATLLKSLTDAGMPLLSAMVIADFPPAQIAAVKAEQLAQQKREDDLADRQLKLLSSDSTEPKDDITDPSSEEIPANEQ